MPEPHLGPGDLLPDPMEDQFEPGMSPERRQQLRQQIRKAAAKAASLAEMRDKMQAASQDPASMEPQRGSAMMKAVRDAYSPPWELAMQRWMDSLVPGERTYARPSRRGAEDVGFVRPGRRRRRVDAARASGHQRLDGRHLAQGARARSPRSVTPATWAKCMCCNATRS